MKKFFLLLVIFLFSCAQQKEIIKYKDFYNFNGFLKLKTLLFQPFPQDISFKAKIKLIVNGKKYTFYSVIYSYKNYCRIFSYALFGKKIGDIFFINNKIYIVPGKAKVLYIAFIDNQNKNKSLFNFLKDIIKGIYLNNAYTEGDCYKGFYYNFLGTTCKRNNFNRIHLVWKNQKREVKILDVKNGLPNKILIDFPGKKLLIEVKKFLKPEIDPEKSFFNYVKGFKKYYAKDLIELENAMLMEKKNENKKNSKRD